MRRLFIKLLLLITMILMRDVTNPGHLGHLGHLLLQSIDRIVVQLYSQSNQSQAPRCDRFRARRLCLGALCGTATVTSVLLSY